MAGLLTPTGQPSQLTLSSLELHLYHVRNVVTVLLNKCLSASLPSESRPTHLSYTGQVPTITTKIVLVTPCCLQRKPISLFQTQAGGNPYLFHCFNNIWSTSIILERKGGWEEWGRHDKGRRDERKKQLITPTLYTPKKIITPNKETKKHKQNHLTLSHSFIT